MNNETKKEKLVPELRFPGFEGEWEVKKLREIAEVNPIRMYTKLLNSLRQHKANIRNYSKDRFSKNEPITVIFAMSKQA